MIYHIRGSALTPPPAFGPPPPRCLRPSRACMWERGYNVFGRVSVYSAATAMLDLYALIRPVLRRLPAETAHNLTLRALEAGLGRLSVGPLARDPDPPILAQRPWGL